MSAADGLAPPEKASVPIKIELVRSNVRNWRTSGAAAARVGRREVATRKTATPLRGKAFQRLDLRVGRLDSSGDDAGQGCLRRHYIMERNASSFQVV